jgi:hypothetical protein
VHIAAERAVGELAFALAKTGEVEALDAEALGGEGPCDADGGQSIEFGA